MKLSKAIITKVLKRDDDTCVYCEKTKNEIKLSVQYDIPLEHGGLPVLENLVTICSDCSSGMSEDRESLASSFEGRKKLLLPYGDVLAPLIELEMIVVPNGWHNSMSYFLRKLDYSELYNAAKITASKTNIHPSKTWNYFCGVCHCKIRAITQ